MKKARDKPRRFWTIDPQTKIELSKKRKLLKKLEQDQIDWHELDIDEKDIRNI